MLFSINQIDSVSAMKFHNVSGRQSKQRIDVMLLLVIAP